MPERLPEYHLPCTLPLRTPDSLHGATSLVAAPVRPTSSSENPLYSRKKLPVQGRGYLCDFVFEFRSSHASESEENGIVLICEKRNQPRIRQLAEAEKYGREALLQNQREEEEEENVHRTVGEG